MRNTMNICSVYGSKALHSSLIFQLSCPDSLPHTRPLDAKQSMTLCALVDVITTRPPENNSLSIGYHDIVGFGKGNAEMLLLGLWLFENHLHELSWGD